MSVYWLQQAAADVPEHDDWLHRNEVERLSCLRVPKRRADWRLGRWTAKHAVAAVLDLGFHTQTLAQFEIRAATTGAPQVFFQNNPVNLCISISHREGKAICALSPAGTVLGCDLEFIEEHGQNFLEDYFNRDEQSIIQNAAPQDAKLLVALLWSAKESALKAMQTGLRLDTRSVTVTLMNPALSLEAQPTSHSLRLKSEVSSSSPDSPEWYELTISSKTGQFFSGWWQRSGAFVSTIVTMLPTTIPLSLFSTVVGNRTSSRTHPFFL